MTRAPAAWLRSYALTLADNGHLIVVGDILRDGSLMRDGFNLTTWKPEPLARDRMLEVLDPAEWFEGAECTEQTHLVFTRDEALGHLPMGNSHRLDGPHFFYVAADGAIFYWRRDSSLVGRPSVGPQVYRRWITRVSGGLDPGGDPDNPNA